jgi:DNA-binding transcriptional ArsR family regulator
LTGIWLFGKIGKCWLKELSMRKTVRERYEDRAGVMKALAHPTRLCIVDELSRGERCVGELTEMIGDDVSTVSRHLSVLKNVRIVLAEKRGSEVYYSLRMACVLGFFECVEDVLRGGES